MREGEEAQVEDQLEGVGAFGSSSGGRTSGGGEAGEGAASRVPAADDEAEENQPDGLSAENADGSQEEEESTIRSPGGYDDSDAVGQTCESAALSAYSTTSIDEPDAADQDDDEEETDEPRWLLLPNEDEDHDLLCCCCCCRSYDASRRWCGAISMS